MSVLSTKLSQRRGVTATFATFARRFAKIRRRGYENQNPDAWTDRPEIAGINRPSMNSPPDLGGGSDDPLRSSPEEEHNGHRAERSDTTLWLLDVDAPAPRIRDLAEESIGPSATSPLGEGATVESVRVRSFAAPYILAPDILDLKTVREAPRRALEQFVRLGRFALATSITVVVTVTLLYLRALPTGWTDGTGGHAGQTDSTKPRFIAQTQAAVDPRSQGKEQPNSPRARLVVLRAPPGSADEVIPLGLSLAGASRGAALVLTGLPVGWTISTGLSLGADNWVLSASELNDAAIRPPRGFVGAIDLAVELRLADDTVADRLSLRLTRVEASKTATAAAQTSAVAAPVRTGNIGQLRETPNSQATSAPLRRLDHDEIADLRKRGEEFMAAGNLGSARLFLQRAAEAGDPQAAFALATTYDPILLETRKVIGIVSDIAMARVWYEKAKEFGSTDASLRLELFASRDR
jgi:hypothetical protein